MTTQSRVLFEIKTGFFAPLDSLKFFRENKVMFVAGVSPFLVGLGAYIWFLKNVAVVYLTNLITSWGWLSETSGSFLQFLYNLTFLLLSVLLFGFLVLPILNVLASPVFDVIAGRAFESQSGKKLPPTTLKGTLQSAFSELVKTCILFAAFGFSLLMPLASPIVFTCAVWFFGWEIQDRTLSQANMKLKDRFFYGIRHFPACFALGLWMYIPFAGSVLSFSMAAAGALTVAKIGDKRVLVQT